MRIQKDSNSIVITNGKVFTPIRLIDDGVLVIIDGRVKAVGTKDECKIPPNVPIINAEGKYVAPGFIETHVHGGGGGDVMSGDPDAVIKSAEAHAKGGVTAMFPTTITAPIPTIIQSLEAVEEASDRQYNGASIIGVHIEGPYFNPAQAGAQNPAYIKNPDVEELNPILDRFPIIRRVSVAPELPGAMEMGQELRRRGVIASIAHTDAIFQDVVKAVENGYTHVTHMFSGMSHFRRMDAYRIAGVMEAVLAIDELTTELIADGHHIPPSMIRMVINAKGVQNVCVTTDATHMAGMGAGKSELFGLKTVVDDTKSPRFELPTQRGEYVAKLADLTAFAGSVATMDQIIRTMISHPVGLSLSEAIKMATTIPARIHGLHRDRGMLSPGMVGDAVIFDEHINVGVTVVEGRVVFNAADCS